MKNNFITQYVQQNRAYVCIQAHLNEQWENVVFIITPCWSLGCVKNHKHYAKLKHIQNICRCKFKHKP